MINTLPKNQGILKYENFFNEPPPENILSLISDCCKTTLLGEFAYLNYKLKPKTTMYYDTSLNMQIYFLNHFCGYNPDLYDKYFKIFKKYIYSKKNYLIIFTRQTCLYASEQIINSSLEEIEGFTLKNSWEKLFCYLLAVNSMITLQTDEDVNDNDESKTFNLETLNPKLVPLNELSIETNPIYTPYRGYKLLSYIFTNDVLGSDFRKYFDEKYKISFDQFIYELLSMYYANNRDGKNNITNEITGETLDTTFYYTVKGEDAPLFEELSKVFKSDVIERLISIKKYPFHKSSDGQFLLMDNILLLDKSYYQFINDFWFDCIRIIKDEHGKEKYNISQYRATIGYFFENYVKEIFDYCFNENKYHVVKMFDELKIKSENGDIELADVYVRYHKKIFIAEVKSTGFYDDQKYTGSLNEMYRDNREGFFNSFGVGQIVKSITNLSAFIKQIDPGFPEDRNCHIFPAVIVNEKALQTPLMAEIFNERFNEMISELKFEKLILHPLSIIHISDLEQMEDHLQISSSEFWRILKYHLRNPDFIPTFYNSLNRLDIKTSFKKTMTLFKELTIKYQRTNEP